MANPTGGMVADGSALIESTGNMMTITTSDRAVIHWQGFSIGAGETTQFVQPSSSSAVLNRVTSGDASHILGTLQANGQVYLLNPNGVFIGNGAVINVGSFLATTANIADTDFMKGGNLTFSGTTEASIVNQGAITAMTGDVMLLAQTVKNTESGAISAPQGTVAMAAGTQFYLKKDEIGAMQVEVKPEAVPGFKGETGVDNAGLLQAMRVQLEADGNLYGLAINQQGLVRATGVSHASDGTIVLSAPGGTIRQSGTMLAVNADGSGGQLLISGKDVSLTASSLATAAGAVDGGEIKISADGDALIGGRLSVDGATGKAGRIQITGSRVGLLDAKVTADGATGGGEVLVGGDYQGGNPLVRNAKATVLDRESVISADATKTGDGGKVILWSDDYTGFYGDISAQGGGVSGNGGLIETSSKGNLQAVGRVTTAAPMGKSGLWLLDPADLTIANAADNNITPASPFQPINSSLATSILDHDTLHDALENNTSVEIRTVAGGGGGTGLITFADWRTPNLTANTTLTVTSVGGITVNNGITIEADSNNSHALNLIFNAVAGVSFNGNSSLDLNGGSFTSSGTTFTLGTGTLTTTAQANSVIPSGAIQLNHSGNIILGGNVVTTGANHNNGVGSAGGAVSITATGTATIELIGNITTSGGNNGNNTTTGGNAGSITFNTDSQNIILTGATITASGGSGATRGSGGTITFSDQVLLQTAASSVVSGTMGAAGGGDILFSGNVDGAQNLSLTAGTGSVTFDGLVGVTQALANLDVTAGTIHVNTTAITTSNAGGGTGNQTYTGAVTLGTGNDTTVTLTATGGTVSFGGTVDATTAGEQGLTVAGNASFGGVVGGTALRALSVSGTTALNTTAVTTSNAGGGTGDQTYTGAVTAGAVTFAASSGGNLNLSNANNNFTGMVEITSANGVTLRDANALQIGATSTVGGQVFVAGGTITATGAKVSTSDNILLQSTGGGVTLNAGSSFNSNLTQIVVSRGQSFTTAVGAPAFTGTAQIFTDRASLNSPSSLDAGLSGFTPTFDVTPVVTLLAAPGAYTLSNSTGPTPSGNVVTYLPAAPGPGAMTDAERNQIISTAANLTSIPVSLGALRIFLPSLDPVNLGALFLANPASRASSGAVPWRNNLHGETKEGL